MKKLQRIFSVLFLLTTLQSCTTYSTTFNIMEKLQDPSLIKKGKVCSNNLFGGFTLPWIGDTAIRMHGDQSVMAAIEKADIKHVNSIDFSTEHYIIFSRRCTIVFGY